MFYHSTPSIPKWLCTHHFANFEYTYQKLVKLFCLKIFSVYYVKNIRGDELFFSVLFISTLRSDSYSNDRNFTLLSNTMKVYLFLIIRACCAYNHEEIYFVLTLALRRHIAVTSSSGSQDSLRRYLSGSIANVTAYNPAVSVATSCLIIDISIP